VASFGTVKWISVYRAVRHSFVALNVPINWPHYRHTHTALMENHIGLLYTPLKFVPCFYPAPTTNWLDIWPGQKFFRIHKSVMRITQYKFTNTYVDQYWYQISDTKYLLVESNITKGCVCLTQGYPQFTAFVTRCTQSILLITYLNLRPVIPILNKNFIQVL
jgi:hypothetical protein